MQEWEGYPRLAGSLVDFGLTIYPGIIGLASAAYVAHATSNLGLGIMAFVEPCPMACDKVKYNSDWNSYMAQENLQPLLEDLKKDISHMRNDIDMIKASILPAEKASPEERAELRKILAEMEAGKKTKLEDIDV